MTRTPEYKATPIVSAFFVVEGAWWEGPPAWRESRNGVITDRPWFYKTGSKELIPNAVSSKALCRSAWAGSHDKPAPVCIRRLN